MLMNVLASGVLFLFIGPFEHVSSAETKETDVSVLQVEALEDVYIAVNEILELNCSFNGTVHDIHVTQLGWKHNNAFIPNSTHIVNNNTIQLRINHTRYEDAGVYACGVFNYSPKFHNIKSQNITVVVGEKPTAISQNLFQARVYGRPVQEVTIQWQTLQVNVTYELFVGRFPAGKYFCNLNDAPQCKLMAWNQNQILSCFVGNDVLGQLFQVRNELLSGDCNDSSLHTRCDVFCAKVMVKNAFGVSESQTVHWNLFLEARCPPLHNLSVSVGEHNMTVSWQRPLLVWETIPLNYYVTYNGTSRLTGKLFHQESTEVSVNYVTFNDSVVPFARYNFQVICGLSTSEKDKGPPSKTEVTTKQAAPAEAPLHVYCEVRSKSTNSAFVTWKAPPIETWNGIPRSFLVQYGEHRVVVNTSLQALSNSSARHGIMLRNLDPHSNYTVRVAMCTEVGCGGFSQPCFIQDVPEEDSTIKVVDGPSDKTGPAGVETSSVIVLGVFIGMGLVLIVIYLVKQRRSRKRVPRRTIDEALGGPLDGAHPYENESDDRPSFCDDDYDRVTFPLMKDVGSTVGNIPVTEI